MSEQQPGPYGESISYNSPKPTQPTPTNADHEHEYFSLCCGAAYGGEVSQHGFCPQCRDHTAFDCECGEEWTP